jgi:hypothetical protein
MAWSPPPPPAQPVPGWWIELSFDRWAAGVAAEMRAAEQVKRPRQLRRRVERIDEQLALAAGASAARRTLRRQAIPYERSARRGPIEHSRHVGQILSVR